MSPAGAGARLPPLKVLDSMNLAVPGSQIHPLDRTRGVKIVLGPTNTGKTHYAIERMLAHPTGMIGLPLRLLAREVYNRVVEKVGPAAVALVTGEEKIKPEVAALLGFDGRSDAARSQSQFRRRR